MSKAKTTRKPRKGAKKPKKDKPKTKAEPIVVKVGDFILADFVGRTSEDQQLFETTKEDVAKKAGVHSEEEVYQPRLVIVGQGWVIPGIDEILEGMKVGQKKKLVLEPVKAFGVRDPKQVRILPRGRVKTDKKLVRGMRVRLGDQTGTVRHVGGGRVTVDFNSPLAGRTGPVGAGPGPRRRGDWWRR